MTVSKTFQNTLYKTPEVLHIEIGKMLDLGDLTSMICASRFTKRAYSDNGIWRCKIDELSIKQIIDHKQSTTAIHKQIAYVIKERIISLKAYINKNRPAALLSSKIRLTSVRGALEIRIHMLCQGQKIDARGMWVQGELFLIQRGEFVLYTIQKMKAASTYIMQLFDTSSHLLR